jgi:murein DD-endopeptidase MepM/ murein hydrolase activator NlpD
MRRPTRCGRRARPIQRPGTGRASGRRFDHAHRIDRPGAPSRDLGSLRIRPPRRVGRPGTASIIALGAIALLIVTLWASPSNPRPASNQLAAGPTAEPVVGGRASAIPGGGTVAGAGTAPTIGPHGEVQPQTSAAVQGGWTIHNLRPADPADLAGYQWPLDHSRITNGFGRGRPGSFIVDGMTMHDGIDLSTFCGDGIVAAHDGVVLTAGRHHEAYVGWLGSLDAYRTRNDEKGWLGLAITVVIDDGNGYRSLYTHFGRTVVVRGQSVQAGELIGYEGSTGNSTGCHLHYALFSPLERQTISLDPEIARKARLPGAAVARIDPFLVMPPIEAAGITWGWGAGAPD